MPRVSTETIGTGDQSWIGSTHGIYNCRSVAPDPAAFLAADFPGGKVPSGTRLAIVDERAVPFDAAAADGSEVLAGFLYTDQRHPVVVGDNWPLFWHGLVKVDRLPGDAFDPAGIDSTGQFTYEGA